MVAGKQLSGSLFETGQQNAEPGDASWGNTVVRLCWNMFIYRSKIKLWYVYSCTTPMYHLLSPGSPRTKKPDEDCEWRPANLPILSVFSTISVRVLGIKSLSVLDHHHSGAANFGLYSSYWYLWSYPIYTYIYIYIHTYKYIYKHLYIYICIYIETYIHRYIDT